MIYDSLDKIPLKLFLSILDTDDLSRLCTKKKELKEDLAEIWKRLKKEYNLLGYNSDSRKIIDTSRLIAKLEAKYNFVIMACQALIFDRDLELENGLRELRYKLREETFRADIEAIQRESKNIHVKISRLSLKLPKQSKEAGEKATIDRVIMGYISITGIQYDTNLITVMQFDALKKIADEKIQAMENQIKKNKQKSKPKAYG